MSESEQVHRQASLLLPWYVNETLAEDERDFVRAHLAECAECRDDLGVLQTMRESVVAGSAAPIVPKPRVAELLSRLNGASDVQESPFVLGRWLIAATIGAISVALAWLVVEVAGNRVEPTVFETATSMSSVTTMDYVVRLDFDDSVGEADRERILAALGARDVTRDLQASGYRAVITAPAMSFAELQQFTERVESMDGVQAMGVLALQLPVDTRSRDSVQ